MNDDERAAELKQQAIAARARGDWEAERKALDALALIELKSTCEGMADGPGPSEEED
ncbi:hypothetical protein [Mycolicibacterium sp. YH-1]|uniref:hypothetical protein n=1 Tax=Mycolicibacterium sp. YH-1 TaxID=2908837 RepID=UPI001F4C3BD3|nr:hypothetical protein [Mycolicibacterium sp. YH-1]UNB54034.1 hypothetical protein L0M16_06770 [Mycolicibacterium sp. YH-1]